jgi:glucose-1-phosphate adenylyltransferase
VRHSVVGTRTCIRSGSRVVDSVLLGNDFYEEPGESGSSPDGGAPPVGIGRNCLIERAIIDKNARVGDDVVITSKSGRPDLEGTNHWIRDGVIVVPRGRQVRDQDLDGRTEAASPQGHRDHGGETATPSLSRCPL